MAERFGRQRVVPVLALVVTTMLWGTSFATVKTCGEVLRGGASAWTSAAFGPLLLTALRFTVALPLVLACWPAARAWRFRRRDAAPLLKVSLAMSAGFLTQAAGMAWTTATISAFLTSLVVCLTPAAEWALHRRGLSGRLLAAILLAVAGTALMTLTGGGAATFGRGEGLTLICAAAFALQVLWTGEAADRMGAAGLTVGTFAVTALVSWAAVLVPWAQQVPGALLAAAASAQFLWMFAVIVFLATIGAMALMNAYQRYIRPSEAAVIYTSEPVFAAGFAYALIGPSEVLSRWGLLGAALLLAADLLAGVRFRRKRAITPATRPQEVG